MNFFFRLEKLELGVIQHQISPVVTIMQTLHNDIDEPQNRETPEMVRALFGRESINGGIDTLNAFLTIEESKQFQVGKEYKISIEVGDI